MKKRTNKDLGFNQVIENVSSYALSHDGKKRVINSSIVFDKIEYEKRQERISIILDCLSQADFLPDSFPNINNALISLDKNPTHALPGEWILDIGNFVSSAIKLEQFLKTDPEEYRFESFLTQLTYDLKELKKDIFYTLVSPGVVRENYPSLVAIRKKIEANRKRRDSFSSEFIHSSSDKMQSANPVYKDGRVMFPIKNEHRNTVDGYVHSSSSSGSTFFIEPLRMVELNNNVIIAEEEIQIEIAKILSNLSSKILELKDNIKLLVDEISVIDWYYSFAMWVNRNNCTKVIPEFEKYSIKLIGARHPLLKAKCVPIDVEIDSNIKAVVLTGPNAGGKTVTMKTIGLFAMLNQVCGFLPCKDGTSLGIFNEIYTDIGDDQSIELSLSTFSGHMKQIGYILNSLDENSLIILDELGSGTEAQEGAAIARAVLEYCIEKGGLTLVTSHHAVLKQFAYSNEKVLSASMEFDEAKGIPTFHFISGLPGESHAVDTAKKMGVPISVVDKAKQYLGSEAVKISSIIKSLERKNLEADKKLREIESRYKELNDEIKENDLLSLRLRQKEYMMKKNKLHQVDKFIDQTRKDLEHLVGELRVGEITREKTKKVKGFIKKLEETESIERNNLKKEEESLENFEIIESVKLEPGMSVLCGKYEREGVIVRQESKDKWIVAIGQIKFTFKTSQLKAINKKESTSSVRIDFHSSSPKPKLVIDLRGYTAEEAIKAVDVQMEGCLVHGITCFSIIHGYGNGILSNAIHDWLRNQSSVVNFYFALPDDGGQGKTYVEL